MVVKNEQQDVRVVVYLDDDPDPLLTYKPPVRFELDTSQLADGPHRLRIESYDPAGQKSERTVPFVVRNGPHIDIDGVRTNDVLEGNVPVLVNSYGGAGEVEWEPSRAETPAPVPTWAWVLLILVIAFGIFYGIRKWNPPPAFAGIYSAQFETASAGGGDSRAQTAESSGSGAKQANTGGGSNPDLSALGKNVYASHCASCHQASGKGLPGAFPPLAGDPVVTADDPAEHIKTVLHGAHGRTIQGETYAAPMPPFAKQLSNKEIAAVINHERTSWGNSAPAVTPADVAALR